MKKIVFGITGLTLGGAERVLVDTVNALKDDYSITIFTIYGHGEFEHQVDPKVTIKSLYPKKYQEYSFFKRKWFSVTLLVPFLRRRIFKKHIENKYDVEISFLEGPITWLFSEKSKAKKIAWVHNDITKVFGTGLFSSWKQDLSKKMYQKYERLVFVSKDNQKAFVDLYGKMVPSEVIYNYLDDKRIHQLSTKFIPEEIQNSLPTFVTVARLTEQKGLDRLMRVHKRLIDDGYLHEIFVVGNGPLWKELNDLQEQLEVSKTFHLLGKRENPYPYINAGDYFLLTSRFEGYGMVIIEAEVLGKYIMITDTAAREAIMSYKEAMMVTNDEEGIYQGMRKILEHKPKGSKKTIPLLAKSLTQIKQLIAR